MGVLSALLRMREPRAFSRSSDPDDPAWWTPEGWIGPQALGGGSMNMALHLSAFYACVRAIAQPLAMVPLITYEYLEDGGKRRAPFHPLYSKLHDRPNPEMTAMEFREILSAHAVSRGAGYARIVPDMEANQPIGQLVPLHPDYVVIERLPSGELRYLYREPGRRDEILLFDEVFKVRGLSIDGVTGVSVIEYARRTLDISSAVEEYSKRYYLRGGAPRGALQYEIPVDQLKRKQMEAEFAERVRGVDNMHKTMVLPAGLKWQQIGITNRDGQWLEGQQFSLGEYERWFGVPAHVINDLTRATYSNIEEQAIEYVTYTLHPWGARWEQSISRDLIINPRRFRAEHLWDALLRGRTVERYQAYRLAWWMTGNEIRERENMNPLPGLDEPMIPVNMLKQSSAVQQAEGERARATAAARLFGLEAARRAVVHECRAVEKAAKEHADNGAAWERWLEQWYGEHERYLEVRLHLTPAIAHGYAERHRRDLLSRGVGVIESWEVEEIPALVALMLDDRLGLKLTDGRINDDADANAPR